MAPKFTYFITIFSFLFFCNVATGTIFGNNNVRNVTATGTRVTSPRLGALVTPQGKLNFITAIMVVDLKLEVDHYIQDQMKEIYDHTEHLLQFFKIGQLYMSLPQKAAIDALIKSISYTFGEILHLMPSEFIQDTLKFASIDQLESDWRQLVFDALQRINIGTREKHVAPHVLHHSSIPLTPSERTVRTTTTPPKFVQNDMTPHNVTYTPRDVHSKSPRGVHPKYRVGTQYTGYKRTKRGLLDIGGSLLSAVFGVSTEQELRNARDKLQGEIKEVAHISEIVQIQALKAESRMKDALTHIKSATESLLSVQLRENRLESFVQCSIILEHIEAVTLHLYDLMRETSTHKTLLQRGIVPQVLTASQLKEIILKGLDTFRSYSFPLSLNELNNKNISEFLRLLHSEKSDRSGYFHVFFPFINRDRQYDLVKLTPFPFIANTLGQQNNKTVLVAGVDLPTYIAIGIEDHVEIESIEKCSTTVNSTQFLCAQKMPAVSNSIGKCSVNILKNETSKALENCDYRQIKLKNGYMAKYIDGTWFIIIQDPQVATIECPDSKYSKRKLNEYVGTIVVRPPCSLSTPTFTLPTIESKSLIFTDVPVQILPIRDVMINNTNTTFPTSDLDAVQRDLDILSNLTSFHAITIKDLSDNGFFGHFNIYHGTNAIVIIVLTIVVGTFLYLARKRPELLFRCCPFLFSSQTPIRSITPTLHTHRLHQGPEEGESISMAQLSSTQQESHHTTESDPLGPSPGEGTVVTPGADEGAYGTTERGAYATIRPPSPHYRSVTRVRPVTPPHKPKRGVRLVLPPVRYTGEDPVYTPSSERGLLDDEGYIIPSSSYPGSI